MATSIPARSLPDPCLPWGTHQQAMIFPAASLQTQMILPQVQPTAPAIPFGMTLTAMGLSSRLGLRHSGPCLSFTMNPRQPRTNCFFPSEPLLPSPSSTHLQLELSKAMLAFCRADMQHKAPAYGPTTGYHLTPSKWVPAAGEAEKIPFAGSTQQL